VLQMKNINEDNSGNPNQIFDYIFRHVIHLIILYK